MLPSPRHRGDDRLVPREQDPPGQRRNLCRECLPKGHGGIFLVPEGGIVVVVFRGSRAGTGTLRPPRVRSFERLCPFRAAGGSHVFGEPGDPPPPSKAQRSVLRLVPHPEPRRGHDEGGLVALVGALDPGLSRGESAPHTRAKGRLAILPGGARHSAPRCHRGALLLDGLLRVFAGGGDSLRAGACAVPGIVTGLRPSLYPRRQHEERAARVLPVRVHGRQRPRIRARHGAIAKVRRGEASLNIQH
mmetsp:Transcript_18862/g.38712  ORF Transcript_18862/g.38712 Transcript_18862/m.38712 type:complete len:246 (+) Transcript_18862:234-971(+)